MKIRTFDSYKDVKLDAKTPSTEKRVKNIGEQKEAANRGLNIDRRYGQMVTSRCCSPFVCLARLFVSKSWKISQLMKCGVLHA